MRTESYTEADQRAEALLASILVKPYTGGAVAKAITAGNIWRALSTGVGWDPIPKNPIDSKGRPIPRRAWDLASAGQGQGVAIKPPPRPIQKQDDGTVDDWEAYREWDIHTYSDEVDADEGGES